MGKAVELPTPLTGELPAASPVPLGKKELTTVEPMEGSTLMISVLVGKAELTIVPEGNGTEVGMLTLILLGNAEEMIVLLGNAELMTVALTVLVGEKELILVLVGNAEEMNVLLGNTELTMVGETVALGVLVGKAELIKVLLG